METAGQVTGREGAKGRAWGWRVTVYSRERGVWHSQSGNIRDVAMGRGWGEWLRVSLEK